MTPIEFRDTFNRYYLVHFPDTQKWCRQLSQETKDAWAEMFADIETRDLRVAINQIVYGEEEIAAYDRERTAAILRILSRRAQYKREQKEASRGLVNQGRDKPLGIEGIMRTIGCLEQYKTILSETDRRIAEEGVDQSDRERRHAINREVTGEVLYGGDTPPRRR